MKHLYFLIANVLTLTMSQQLYAETEFYIGATTGTNKLEYGLVDKPQEFEMNPGFVLGGGYYYPNNEQLEWGVDIMTTSQGYETEYSSAVSTTSLSLAGRIKRKLETNISLFAGAGLGAARFNFTSVIPGVNAEAYDAVAHGEFGILYPNDGVIWYGAVKYQSALRELEAEGYRANYNSLSLIAGIRY